MLVVDCHGTPREIGLQHGSAAKTHIERCIAFYTSLFERTSNMSWVEVLEVARDFEPNVKDKWPKYYEEIQGIAQGSNRSVLDIMALNVRTEIAFGRFSDGCTSLAWHTSKGAYLGQNWDWSERQKENLIIVKIEQPDKPAIQMITEAGIIGKIGFNSNGVGVCFNAIRAKGVDPTRIPVHLGLRMVLESATAKEAVRSLEHYGMAAAAHMLISDEDDAIGFEFSSSTTASLLPDSQARVIHANHLVLDHPGVQDTVWLSDSPLRVARMTELSSELHEPTWGEVSHLFEDEDNAPTAICRAEADGSTSATLFNIVMDLRQRQAVIRLGRPCQPEETVLLQLARSARKISSRL